MKLNIKLNRGEKLEMLYEYRGEIWAVMSKRGKRNLLRCYFSSGTLRPPRVERT